MSKGSEKGRKRTHRISRHEPGVDIGLLAQRPPELLQDRLAEVQNGVDDGGCYGREGRSTEPQYLTVDNRADNVPVTQSEGRPASSSEQAVSVIQRTSTHEMNRGL